MYWLKLDLIVFTCSTQLNLTVCFDLRTLLIALGINNGERITLYSI